MPYSTLRFFLFCCYSIICNLPRSHSPASSEIHSTSAASTRVSRPHSVHLAVILSLTHSRLCLVRFSTRILFYRDYEFLGFNNICEKWAKINAGTACLASRGGMCIYRYVAFTFLVITRLLTCIWKTGGISLFRAIKREGCADRVFFFSFLTHVYFMYA